MTTPRTHLHPARVIAIVVATLLCIAACRSAERYAVVEVTDPDGFAGAAASLHYGPRLDERGSLPLGGRKLPVSFGLSRTADGDWPLWVEARDAAGTILGRGRPADEGIVRFRAGRTAAVTVPLEAPCSQDGDCIDESFCDGGVVCRDAVCVATAAPCQSSFECVVATCNEETDTCETTEHRELCPPGNTCSPRYGCTECFALAAGFACPAGEWCATPSESAPFVPGACYACDTEAHCGPQCAICAAGERCDPQQGCLPCDSAARCGPTCGACDGAGPTPLCAGPIAGCVAPDCAGKLDFTRCQLVTSPDDRHYDVCIAGVCVSPGCGTTSCNEAGPAFPWPDSGQRACAAACPAFPCASDGSPTSCGVDAQYGWDTQHSASERYLVTAAVPLEPVVTDRVTGLEWQGCVVGQYGATCERGAGVGFSWSAARDQCARQAWGARRDWRLPNRFELQSIVDFGASPAFDSVTFPNTPQFWLWSSTWSAGLDLTITQDAWSTHFARGTTFVRDSTGTAHARCVRGGGAAATSVRFTRSAQVVSEPVTTDNQTGLTWQGCEVGRKGAQCDLADGAVMPTLNLTGALAHCEGLTWGDASDWRLPSILELTSLANLRVSERPAIDVVAFPETTGDLFFSSSHDRASPTFHWCVDFTDGRVATVSVANFLNVRCVRGGL